MCDIPLTTYSSGMMTMRSDCFQDNCRWVPNTYQIDFDRDGHGNLCDNCPKVKNPNQEDYDEDGQGEECDQDRDGDG